MGAKVPENPLKDVEIIRRQPLPEGLPGLLPLDQDRLQDVLRCPKRRGLPGLPLLETASMISATLTGSTIPATAVTMA